MSDAERIAELEAEVERFKGLESRAWYAYKDTDTNGVAAADMEEFMFGVLAWVVGAAPRAERSSADAAVPLGHQQGTEKKGSTGDAT